MGEAVEGLHAGCRYTSICSQDRFSKIMTTMWLKPGSLRLVSNVNSLSSCGLDAVASAMPQSLAPPAARHATLKPAARKSSRREVGRVGVFTACRLRTGPGREFPSLEVDSPFYPQTFMAPVRYRCDYTVRWVAFWAYVGLASQARDVPCILLRPSAKRPELCALTRVSKRPD